MTKPNLNFEPETLVELLQWRAEKQGDVRAYSFLLDDDKNEVRMTYAELDIKARALAVQLREKHAFGERALLLYPPGPDYVVGFLGCLYAGVIAVPAYLPDSKRLNRTLPHLEAIFKDSQAKFALTTGTILSSIRLLLNGARVAEKMKFFNEAIDRVTSDSLQVPIPKEFAALDWIATDNYNEKLAQNWQPSKITAETLAFLQYTSGSTGTPKGVMVSHGNLISNLGLIANAFMTPDTEAVMWLPIYHDIGLIGGVLQPIYYGVPCNLMSPLDFRQWPVRWLNVISGIKDRHVASGGPNFAYDLAIRKITDEQLDNLDLSNWRVAFSGAEPVRPETLDRFTKTFAACGFRKEAFYPCYGLAEATLFVSGAGVNRLPVVEHLDKDALTHNKIKSGTESGDNIQTFVSSGMCPPEQEIAIVNPESQKRCSVNEVGEIWVAGPSIARGYWNNKEASEETFEAYIEGSGDGPFLRTGDLGFLRNGELYITGRAKDLIIIRGRIYYPQDIEFTAESSHEALRPGCGAAFSVDTDGDERLVVVQEIRPGKDRDFDEIVKKIRRNIVEVHGLQAWSIVLIKARTIFKTSNGKIQRRAVKQEFLDNQLQVVQLQKQSADPSVNKLEKVPRNTDLPLSLSQQRLWVIDQLEPGGYFYNIPIALHLRGRLYIPIFGKAVQEVVRRHETLRTTFDDLRGKPVQVIHQKMDIQYPVLDLTELPAERREIETKRLTEEEAKTPFDLRNGPLIRAQILKLKQDDHIVLFTLHQIIADGWSISILIREIAVFYESLRRKRKTRLPVIGIQYADFASWQRKWLRGKVLETQLNYWKGKLSNISPVLEMPTDRPRPAVQSFRGGRESVVFSKKLSTEIVRLSGSEGVTLFMILLAAFQTLLYLYSGQDDIVVGSQVAGRNHSELEKLIGSFVNNLVLRTTFPRKITFRDLLRKVKETALEAYAHQDIPFERLVNELHPVRNLSHQPVFQVMFVLQNVPLQSVELPGLKMQNLNADAGISSSDLTLIMQEHPDGMLAEFEYNTDLFDSTTISRMLDHLQNLLMHAVRDPECRVSEFELLSAEEKQLQLEEWNATTGSYPKDHCVHEWYETLAERHPDAVAVTFTLSVESGIHQKLTYQELNERANQLAQYLRKLGVKNEKLVGISTERSIEMAIGILATLKAGGAFVPIDPTYSADRIKYMISDSEIEVMLTQKSLLDGLPVSNTKVVCLDSEWPQISQEPKTNLKRMAVPENLAYIIYTSRSTGEAKGTMLRHRGLCNLATAQIRTFGVGIGSKILQFSSLRFDASVWETVMALLSGSTLNLVSRQIVDSRYALVEVMKKLGITTVTLPPSVLAVFPKIPLPKLRTIITAGEKCSSELVEQWSVNRDFFNAYGSAETTVCASLHPFDGDYPFGSPIGKPIMNFELYILDSNMKPVPIGIPGELHIGGAGLARGYLKKPDLTAEKFVPNPFSENPGARLYKSGDLCRYLPDGNVEFLGKIDRQVKVRGFRIELGNVEAVIADFPGTRDVIVIAREDSPGDQRLVAYLVNDADPAPSQLDLRLFLRERLPEYMFPSAFVFLDEMPLTPDKKIDWGALPKPEIGRLELQNKYVAPRNDVEEKLAALTAELLNHDKVGIHDNFFELGGHSILATQFISCVREALQIELPLRVLFEKPTIAEISSEIERLKQEMTSSATSRVPRIRTAYREKISVKRPNLTQKPGGSSDKK